MPIKNSKRLKIFTWHIHGSYLFYLTQTDCDFYLPVTGDNTPGYAGKTAGYTWGENVHEVPVEEINSLDLDIILFQSNYPSNSIYLEDQFRIFSKKQLMLPKIYLEHEPPREHPTDTKHIVDDKDVSLVHVTHFNNLMWNNNRTPTYVIEHGVIVSPNVAYSGKIRKGLVVVNNIFNRGRRLGFDIFASVRKRIPLDIVGIGSESLGGLGEIRHEKLPELMAQYRFIFNPIRYSSLGLSVCEGMCVGVPIFGFATTEMASVIKNGINGYADTDLDSIVLQMEIVLENENYAQQLSSGAKAYGRQRFSIERFKKDWMRLFEKVTADKRKQSVINSGSYQPYYIKHLW